MRKRYAYLQLLSTDNNWTNGVWQNKTGAPLVLVGYDVAQLFSTAVTFSIQDENQQHVFESIGWESVNSNMTQLFAPSGTNTVVQLGDGTIQTSFPLWLEAKPMVLLPKQKIVMSNPILKMDGWFIVFKNLDAMLDYLVTKG